VTESRKRKSILFISLSFFGYEIEIKNAMIENGYDVDFFDERAFNNSIFKAVSRVKKSLVDFIINKYYKNILKKIVGIEYSYFLLIKGEAVPEWFIIEFKKMNPSAKLIFYSFDAIANNRNCLHILKYFDLCFSFDFEDVKTNPLLKLKHLFYGKEYLCDDNDFIKKYTISFVGTLHSNRYTVVKKLFDKFNHTYIFFYLPAKWMFYMYKLFYKQYKKLKWDEVSLRQLSKQQVAAIFKSSKSVLDITRYHQTGLTMRTFEALASGAILITFNPYIKQTEFYNPQNIVVLDDINSFESIAEIRDKIDSLPQGKSHFSEIFEKYYINNWVKEFFE